MHSKSAAIVAAARGCVGTRFRPLGRCSGLALDCVGVALVAARAAGVDDLTTPAYPMSGDNEDRVETVLQACGCRPLGSEPPQPGDLIVVAPAPGRRHLAVVTDTGLVHAHAGLSRVVEAAADPGWVPVSAWRLPDRH